MIGAAIRILSQRLLENLPRFVKPIELDERVYVVNERRCIVWAKGNGLAAFFERLVVLTEQIVIHRQVVMRYVIIWITLGPGLQNVYRFFTIAGDVAGVFLGDVKTLALTHAIAQFVSSL